MQLRNNSLRYGAVHKLIHWVMALTIIAMFIMGSWMEDLPNTPQKFEWYGIHKAIGALLIAAVALRLVWRQTGPVPTLPSNMKWYERLGAHGGHLGLYVLMLALPVSGWLMSSAAGFPVSVFGWFTLPNLIAPDKAMVDTLKEAHEWLATAIIALAAIHALAALYHHFVKKDNVLKRMMP